MSKRDEKKKLTQAVFIGMPKSITWCGVNGDGTLIFAGARDGRRPRYGWTSEKWAGIEVIGEPEKNSGFIPASSLWRSAPDWQDLQHAVTAFADKTFGEASTPVPALHHLLEEVKEIIEAADTGAGTEALALEYADAFILLMQSAQRSGFNMDVIFNACLAKHEINKGRNWGAPDENGVVKHIKENG